MRQPVALVVAFLAASAFGAQSAHADAAPPPPPAPVPAPGPVPDPTPTPTPTPPAPPEKAAERGYLGFQPVPAALLTPSDRETLKVAAETGVVVVLVFPGGPADKAGVKVGDVLTKLNGHDLPDVTGITPGDPHAFPAFNEAFQKLVADWKPGSEIELVVARDGKPVTLKAIAIDKAGMEALRQAQGSESKPPTPPETVDANRGFVGFIPAPVALLSAKEKAHFHVKAEKGVVAVRVTKGSPAEAAGLKDGDVILKYAGQDLPSTADVDPAKPETFKAFQEAFLKISVTVKAATEVALVVERDGKPVTLTAKAVDAEAMKKIAAAAGEGDEDGEDGEDEGAEGPEKGEGKEKGPTKTPPPEKPGTPEK